MSLFFFFNDTATTEIYTLSLHDALPISVHAARQGQPGLVDGGAKRWRALRPAGAVSLPQAEPGLRRSEEHTSELQSPCNLVCRLLLEKKKKRNKQTDRIASTRYSMIAHS